MNNSFYNINLILIYNYIKLLILMDQSYNIFLKILVRIVNINNLTL